MNRQIVLDTESTGMNPVGIRHEGHAIVEIGAVEMIDRRLTGRRFHLYLRPGRSIDPAAIAIHGITDEFLRDKPTFGEIAGEFCDFIRGAELVIHNAPFDVGFIDYEFRKLSGVTLKLAQLCTVIDTLPMARQLFPGKRNSLDALCSRYGVDNSRRALHGALLDAEILAEVYLAMTGGQASLYFMLDNAITSRGRQQPTAAEASQSPPSAHNSLILYATEAELKAHHDQLLRVQEKKGCCLWLTC